MACAWTHQPGHTFPFSASNPHANRIPLFAPAELIDVLNQAMDLPFVRHVLRQTSSESVSQMETHPDKFELKLSVKNFKPDELSVKTVDDYVVIHGKHEETADRHGFVSREFTRRYAIPEGVEASKIQSSLSSDGILTVGAPEKVLELPPKNERIVSITMEQPANQKQPIETDAVDGKMEA